MMSETVKMKRIDQYLCIDIEEIIVDEMKGIIQTKNTSRHPEDIESSAKLQAAAKVVLSNYAGRDDE